MKYNEAALERIIAEAKKAAITSGLREGAHKIFDRKLVNLVTKTFLSELLLTASQKASLVHNQRILKEASDACSTEGSRYAASMAYVRGWKAVESEPKNKEYLFLTDPIFRTTHWAGWKMMIAHDQADACACPDITHPIFVIEEVLEHLTGDEDFASRAKAEMIKVRAEINNRAQGESSKAQK